MTSTGKGVPTLDCVATDGCKVSVQQYVPTSSHGGMIPVIPGGGPDGWVRHADYAALESLLLDARAALDAEKIISKSIAENYTAARERAERAEALAAEMKALLGEAYGMLHVGRDCAFMLARLQGSGVYTPSCSDGKPSNADARRDHDQIYVTERKVRDYLWPHQRKEEPTGTAIDARAAGSVEG